MRILGDEGWLDLLVEKVRTLNKAQRTELELAARYFRKHQHHEYASVSPSKPPH